MSTTLVETIAAPGAVGAWRRYPSLYEINAWVWLSELAQKYHKHVDLASVPSAESDAIADYGFDAVWLMGVWERSPAGIRIANHNQNLLADFRRALPDFRRDDNVGSPYCVWGYVVDQHFGGPEGLAVARRELSNRGMKLVLDLVPNHVAPDHPWVAEHPEYFIRGNPDDVRSDAWPVFREGTWSLCDRSGWPDNASFQNLLAWTWMKDDERYLIAVNLSDCPVQARVQVRWADVGGGAWHLINVLSGATYDRSGDEMLSPGLHVELKLWTITSSSSYVRARHRIRAASA